MSKKLTITMLAMQAIIAMGVTAPAEDQFKYGCLIVGLAVTYKSIQGILDYLKGRNNGEQK